MNIFDNVEIFGGKRGVHIHASRVDRKYKICSFDDDWNKHAKCFTELYLKAIKDKDIDLYADHNNNEDLREIILNINSLYGFELNPEKYIE